MYFIADLEPFEKAPLLVEYDEGKFPDDNRLSDDTARKIYSIISKELGSDFKWHFADSPDVQWSWSKLITVLESGSGWTLPEFRANGVNANLRLIVQFVNRSGRSLDPILFLAKASSDSSVYELTGVFSALGSEPTVRKLSFYLNEALKGQKSPRDSIREYLKAELATVDIAKRSESSDSVSDANSDILALFEALVHKEWNSNTPIPKLSAAERAARIAARQLKKSI